MFWGSQATPTPTELTSILKMHCQDNLFPFPCVEVQRGEEMTQWWKIIPGKSLCGRRLACFWLHCWFSAVSLDVIFAGASGVQLAAAFSLNYVCLLLISSHPRSH
uniref:Uncharacterized protein n=1 Tax=Salvator merianae TaxID=96440 RepID=A0A8D0B5U8_SALMN